MDGGREGICGFSGMYLALTTWLAFGQLILGGRGGDLSISRGWKAKRSMFDPWIGGRKLRYSGLNIRTKSF